VTYSDIYSGWTTNRAVWNKGAAGVVKATRDVEAALPLAILQPERRSSRPTGSLHSAPVAATPQLKL